jgi:hypothetical protein
MKKSRLKQLIKEVIEEMTRRDFLRASLGGIAGAALGGKAMAGSSHDDMFKDLDKRTKKARRDILKIHNKNLTDEDFDAVEEFIDEHAEKAKQYILNLPRGEYTHGVTKEYHLTKMVQFFEAVNEKAKKMLKGAKYVELDIGVVMGKMNDKEREYVMGDRYGKL